MFELFFVYLKIKRNWKFPVFITAILDLGLFLVCHTKDIAQVLLKKKLIMFLLLAHYM